MEDERWCNAWDINNATKGYFKSNNVERMEKWGYELWGNTMGFTRSKFHSDTAILI